MLEQAHPKRGDTLQLPLMTQGPEEPQIETPPEQAQQRSLFD